jgi:hypothetical protein
MPRPRAQIFTGELPYAPEQGQQQVATGLVLVLEEAGSEHRDTTPASGGGDEPVRRCGGDRRLAGILRRIVPAGLAADGSERPTG